MFSALKVVVVDVLMFKVVNLNDFNQFGFRICVNLADTHWASTRYRQCAVLGERMLKAIEPHLLAARVAMECMEVLNRNPANGEEQDLSADKDFAFYDGQMLNFARFRAQSQLISGRCARQLKDFSGSEKTLRLGLKEIDELPERAKETFMRQKHDLQIALEITQQNAGKPIDAQGKLVQHQKRLAYLYSKTPISSNDISLNDIALAENSLGRAMLEHCRAIDGSNVSMYDQDMFYFICSLFFSR